MMTRPLATAQSAAPYLLALVLPLLTTAYLLSNALPVAAAWLAVLVAFGALDPRLAPLAPAPPPPPDSRAFDAIAYAIAALAAANVALLAARAGQQGPRAVHAWVAVALVGAGSALSSAVAAHELIHRRSRAARAVGRAALATLLYDHFAVDHVRGHHAHVGTRADPLPARRGETFARYVRRTWGAELRRAWRIAARGPGGNTVARGLAAQAALAAGVALAAGPFALGAFALQAVLAHALVAAANYVQHWGLARAAGRALDETDAWDCAFRVSHYALLGVTLHADHHLRGRRPYPALALRAASPRLPRGYFAMVALVVFRNARARALLEQALARSPRTRSGP